MSQHKLLFQLVKQLPTDFEPYGLRSRTDDWGPDCSCGCKHFLELAGTLGYDWGVCSNQQSPRAGRPPSRRDGHTRPTASSGARTADQADDVADYSTQAGLQRALVATP